jgi:hypothetical protein
MTSRVQAGAGHQQIPAHHKIRNEEKVAAGRRVRVESSRNEGFLSGLIKVIAAIFCCLFCCRVKNEDSVFVNASDRGNVGRGGNVEVRVNNPPVVHVPVGHRNDYSSPFNNEPVNNFPRVIPQNNNRPPVNNHSNIATMNSRNDRAPVNSRNDRAPVNNNRGNVNPGAPVIRQQVGLDKDRRK